MYRTARRIGPVVLGVLLLGTATAGAWQDSRPVAPPDSSRLAEEATKLRVFLQKLTNSADDLIGQQKEAGQKCQALLRTKENLDRQQAKLADQEAANDREIKGNEQEQANWADASRKLSKTMTSLGGELLGLEKKQAKLNEKTKQLNGEQPRTAAERADHEQRRLRHNKDVEQTRQAIRLKTKRVVLLLPQGEFYRQTGKRLKTKAEQLRDTRKKVLAARAKVAGELASHRNTMKEQVNATAVLRKKADSHLGSLKDGYSQADAYLKKLETGGKKDSGRGRPPVKQITLLRQAYDDARKAWKELQLLQGQTNKSAQQLEDNLRPVKP